MTGGLLADEIAQQVFEPVHAVQEGHPLAVPATRVHFLSRRNRLTRSERRTCVSGCRWRRRQLQAADPLRSCRSQQPPAKPLSRCRPLDSCAVSGDVQRFEEFDVADAGQVQRRHRALQPARQTGRTRRMWIPKPRQLSPPDTIPLHPQTASSNPDFVLIARSKSKRRHGWPRPATKRPKNHIPPALGFPSEPVNVNLMRSPCRGASARLTMLRLVGRCC